MSAGLRIAHAEGQEQIEAARALFREYQAELGVDLEFQGFARELAGLPGDYQPPGGRLLLAWSDQVAVGCIAMRALEDGACEMKRLYIRPSHRGLGLGRTLALELIDRARAAGHRRMLLDTLPSMQAAQTLYESLGFRQAPAYRFNPVTGTRYLQLDLWRL